MENSPTSSDSFLNNSTPAMTSFSSLAPVLSSLDRSCTGSHLEANVVDDSKCSQLVSDDLEADLYSPSIDSDSALATDNHSPLAIGNDTSPATDNDSPPVIDNESPPATDSESPPATNDDLPSITDNVSSSATDSDSPPAIDNVSVMSDINDDLLFADADKKLKRCCSIDVSPQQPSKKFCCRSKIKLQQDELNRTSVKQSFVNREPNGARVSYYSVSGESGESNDSITGELGLSRDIITCVLDVSNDSFTSMPSVCDDGMIGKPSKSTENNTDERNITCEQASSSSHACSHINDLPYSLLIEIFRNVSLSDRQRNLALVCRCWLQLTRDSDLWKYINMSNQRRLDDATLSHVLTYCNNIVSINISGCYAVTDVGFISLVKTCRSIQELTAERFFFFFIFYL